MKYYIIIFSPMSDGWRIVLKGDGISRLFFPVLLLPITFSFYRFYFHRFSWDVSSKLHRTRYIKYLQRCWNVVTGPGTWYATPSSEECIQFHIALLPRRCSSKGCLLSCEMFAVQYPVYVRCASLALVLSSSVPLSILASPNCLN